MRPPARAQVVALIALSLSAGVVSAAEARAPAPKVVSITSSPRSIAAGDILKVHAKLVNHSSRRTARSTLRIRLRGARKTRTLRRVRVRPLRAHSRARVTFRLAVPHLTGRGHYRLSGCTKRCRSSLRVTRVAGMQVTLSVPSVTNNPRPTFSGRAAPGGFVTVTVRRGTTTVATLQALPASSGTWSVRPSSALPDAAYTAVAQQTGAFGRTQTSASRTFRVDTIAPPVTLDSPAPGATLATPTPTLGGARGTTSGDGAVTVRLYRGSVATGTPLATLTPPYGGTRWSASPGALPDGTYTAQATQPDQAGNTGHSAAVTFTVDASGPAVSLSAPASGSFTPDATPTFSGTAGNLAGDSATVTLKITQGATTVQTLSATRSGGSWSATAPTALADGAYSAQASQQDSAGHTGVSASQTFTVDTTPPTATLTLTPSSPNGQNGFYTSMPTVHATAGDTNFESLTCTVDGTQKALVNGDVPVSGDGSHTVSCTAGDRAGNTTTPAAKTFKVDSTAPSVAITAPAANATTSDQTPTLTGTAGTASGDSSSLSVKVYSGTDTSGAALQSFTPTRDAGGNWSAGALDTLPVGTYTAAAKQTDSAGNSRTVTRAFKSPAVMLAAGDIASCDQTGDTQTAQLLSANPADKIAVLGDNAYEDGSAADFSNCYDPTWGVFKDKTAPAAGNHEYETTGAAGYFGYFGAAAGTAGQGWYSYDLGAWHIIVLNSSDQCNPVACSSGPQRTFLQNDLAAHTNQCTMAYWHHPLFTSDSNAFAGPTTQVKPFWDDLYAAGADVVLNGHSHVYERFGPQTPSGVADSANGIREFIVGTGGYTEHSVSAPVANSEALNNDTFGVLKLTLRPTDYSWKFLPVAGKTFTDSGSASCH